jgi:hypothetical protein
MNFLRCGCGGHPTDFLKVFPAGLNGWISWGDADFETYQRHLFHHLEVPVSTPPPPPLLTVRAALVFLAALLVGVLAVALSLLGGASVPSAVLLAGGATGAALLLFHTIIGR